MSLQTSLRNELLRFCHSTTLRGVPRIVKAPNKAIGALWLTAVISLFIGLFTCMFFLARQYMAYDVIHPPRVLRDTASPFPSMTICNLRPISPSGLKNIVRLNLRDPRDFARNLNNFSAEVYYNRGQFLDYEMVTSAISMGGFLESLPLDTALSLGHTRNETIIQCRVLYLEGSSRVTQSCDQVGEWTHFLHALFLNCYTFNLKPSFSDHVLTIELFAYLDEPTDNICHDCFATEIKSQLSGAVVVVHNANTYPDVNDDGINIQPGTLTEFKFKAIQNIQKTPPHGRCSLDTPTSIRIHNNITYAYSEYACRMMYIQAEINKKCSCNAIEFPYIDPTLPSCMSLPDFVLKNRCDSMKISDDDEGNNNDFIRCASQLNQTRQRLDCKSNVTRVYQGDVVPNCTLPCAFYSYETDRSTSTWPTKSWQLTWLQVLGKNLLDKPEMKPYRTAGQLLEENANGSKILDILMKNNVLERNLLAVIIVRPNFNLHKVEEKEVLSLTSLLSQTGGLLSIWVGLTMICIVELIDLFINCVLACRVSRTSKHLENDFHDVDGVERPYRRKRLDITNKDRRKERKLPLAR